jgi:Xaa-Pro aminopeptidase
MNNILKSRISKVKEALKVKNTDAFLVTKTENKFYISGFSSSNFYILLTESKDYLLTDFRYIEAAKALSDTFEIVRIDNEYTTLKFIKEKNFDALGIEYKSITFDFYNELKEKSKIITTIPCDNIIDEIRTIKEIWEIDKITQAAEIANKGFVHILDFIKVGVSEKQIAMELEFFLKKNGADALSFDTIIASGKNGALPHAIPSNKKVENGDFVTMDFGVLLDHYCSDMTRTIAVGRVSDKQKEVYNIVLKAQETALSQIKVGIATSYLDSVARDIINEAGYGEYFGHGLGHGVGLEIHEAPTLNQSSVETIKADMLVTIEPGIYIPDGFGVRIEDLAIVGESDIIILTKVDKKLIIL